MEAELQAQIAFHLTGRSPANKLDSLSELGLRPALFAGYRDLTKLRYDFPLVLSEGGTDQSSVQSLSAVFDRLLNEIAQGVDGERLRKHALRLEQEMVIHKIHRPVALFL